MSIRCPLCNKDDEIRKVIGIYSAGVSSVSTAGSTIAVVNSPGDREDSLAGGYTMLQGVSQTGLSARLAPPPKPAMKNPTSIPALLLVAVWIGGLMCLAQRIGNLGSNRQLGTVVFVMLLVIGSSFVIVLLARLSRLKAKAREKWEAEVALWQKVVSKWGELYYCARDDIVFDPTTEQYAPVGGMYELLYHS
jgi:hypothetical protein